MYEAEAQALVDELRAAGAARIVLAFETDGTAATLGSLDLYSMQPNDAGDGVTFDALDADSGAIATAASTLLNERYAGKIAAGQLKVDEEDRVWSDGVVETDATPSGLRVDL